MKNLLLIFYLFSACVGMLAQQKAHLVEYEFFPNPLLLPESIMIPSVLFVDDSISTYTKLLKQAHALESEDDEAPSFNPAAYNLHMIQDKNSIFYEEEAWKGKRIVLKDSISYEWNLLSDAKTILGYNCYAATAEIRGREYIAWYTPEIPISYGPWKLKGLPGLILEAYTIDESYRFTAVAYSNAPNPEEIARNYKIYSIYSDYKKTDRNDYVKEVIEQYRRMDKKDNSSRQGYNTNRSEVIAMEMDLSYTSEN